MKMGMRYDISPMYVCKIEIWYYIYLLQVFGIEM